MGVASVLDVQLLIRNLINKGSFKNGRPSSLEVEKFLM